MTELTDDRKREITEGLAKWAGWKVKVHQVGILTDRPDAHVYFDPFESLDDARLLLVECDRKGLLWEVVSELSLELDGSRETPFHSAMQHYMAIALLSTAEQQTLAVREVVEKLNKETGGA